MITITRALVVILALLTWGAGVIAAPSSASTMVCVGDTTLTSDVALGDQVTCTITADNPSVAGDFVVPTTISGTAAGSQTFSAITSEPGSNTKFTFTLTTSSGGTLDITGRLATGTDFSQGAVSLTIFSSPPSVTVSGAVWSDGDPTQGNLGGTITMTLPADESSLTHYQVYWSADQSTVLSSASSAIATVTKGSTQLTIPLGTAIPSGAQFLLVRASNPVASKAPGKSLPVTDAVVSLSLSTFGSTARANSEPVVVADLVTVTSTGTTISSIKATPADTSIVSSAVVELSSGNLTYTPGTKAGSTDLSIVAEFGSGDGTTPSALFTVEIIEIPSPSIISFAPAAGPGCGTTILTVTGSNFGVTSDDLLDVKVGTSSCKQFWWDNPERVRCEVPTDITSGNVKITTIKATATSTGVFSVDVSKRESLSYVVPSSAPSAKASVVTIAGANIDPAFSYVSVANSNCTKVEYVSSALVLCTTGTPNQYQSGPVELGKSKPTDCVPGTAPIFTFTGPRISSVQPAQGPTYGFLTVTVRGSYLGDSVTDITEFSVAGVNCFGSFEFIDSTELHCTPRGIPGPAVGPVIVSTVQGGTVASSVQFTYFDSADVNPADRPRIRSIEPASVSYLGAEVVTVLGEKFGDTPDDFLAVIVDGTRWTRECTYVTSATILCTTRPGSVGNKDVFVETRAGSRSLNPYPLPYTFVGALAITAKSGVVNEDGDITDELVAVINQAPVFEVLVRVFVNDSTEGRVSKDTLRFTVDDYQIPQSMAIEGVPDDVRDGDTAFAITFEVESVDAKFEKLPVPAITVVNRESRPVITGVIPGVSPYAGRTVTVVGRNFDFLNVSVLLLGTVLKVPSQVSLIIRNASINPVALDPNEESTLALQRGVQLLQTQPSFGTGLVVDGLVFESPPIKDNIDGYRTITVSNNDGQRAVSSTVLYYTDDCPNPGSFGRGANCGQCPVGGICKGGVRLWPKAGFWNGGENDGIVTQCEPVVRCTGCETARTSQQCYASGAAPCATGYAGELCAECQEGYYETNGICEECPSTGDLILLTLVAVSLWIFVGVGGAVLEDKENFSLLLGFVIAVQEVASVGQLISYQLPAWLRRFYGALYLFAGDLAYLKPECSAKITYEVLYAASITYNIVIGLPLLLGVPLMWRLSRRLNKNKSQYYKEDREQHYRNRWYRVATIHLRIIYFAVTVKSIEAVSCVEQLGTLRLITNRTVQCFTPAHSAVYAVSWIFLLGLTAGYPAVYAWHMHVNKEIRNLDKDFMERWDFIWGPFRQKWRYLWLLEMFAQFTVALCTTILTTSPNIQFLALVAVFSLMAGLSVTFRPFQRRWENYVIAGFNTANVIAMLIIYLSYLNHLSEGLLSFLIYLALLLLLYGMGSIFVITVYNVLWIWQPRSLYRTRRQVQKELVANIEEMSLVTQMFETAPVEEGVFETDRLEAYKDMETKGTQKDLEAVAITLMFAGQAKDDKRGLPSLSLEDSHRLLRKDDEAGYGDGYDVRNSMDLDESQRLVKGEDTPGRYSTERSRDTSSHHTYNGNADSDSGDPSLMMSTRRSLDYMSTADRLRLAEENSQRNSQDSRRSFDSRRSMESRPSSKDSDV